MISMIRPSGGTNRAPVAIWPQVRGRTPPGVRAGLPVAIWPQGGLTEPHRIAGRGLAKWPGSNLGPPLDRRHPTLTAVGMGSHWSGGKVFPRQRGTPETVRAGGLHGRQVVWLLPCLLWDPVRLLAPVRKPGQWPDTFGRPNPPRCPTGHGLT